MSLSLPTPAHAILPHDASCECICHTSTWPILNLRLKHTCANVRVGSRRQLVLMLMSDAGTAGSTADARDRQSSHWIRN
jgi:hypothetical protein